jgi:hypothetical protein
VRLPPASRLDLLALCINAQPLQPMMDQLAGLGIQVDVAHSAQDAMQSFFHSGGHQCLVLGPDVAPGVAAHVVRALRAVDPELPTVDFGPNAAANQPASRSCRLGAFHPSSRAGVGALLRFLHNLPERN